MSDRLSIPAKVTEVVPKGVLVSVAATLKVDKTERITTLERFYKMLESVAAGSPAAVGAVGTVKKEKKGVGKFVYALVASVITTVILLIFFGVGILILFLGGYIGGNSDPSDYPPGSSIVDTSSGPNQGYAPDTQLYKAPADLMTMQYSDVYGMMQTTYEAFKFEIAGRVPHDTVPRGGICDMQVNGQTIKVDDEFPRDTVVKIYISQGKDQVEVPLILGLSVEDAKAMLFDQGFYSDTIILRKAYDVNALPCQVFKVTYGDGDTAITSGTKVSVNELIIVYYREPESQTPEDGMMGGTIDSNPALGQ
jgi:hypothetical protein